MEIDPTLTRERVAEVYGYTDFLGFLRSYKWVNLRLTDPAHFGLITRRLLERLAAQNVAYAELNLSVGVWLWRELEFEPYFEAVAAEAARSAVRVRFIFDAVRQFGVEQGWMVARLAAANRERGVVGFGIGGDEARGPAPEFREVFAWAREQGLRLAPHGGETMGPQSVWDALECGAEGSGTASARLRIRRWCGAWRSAGSRWRSASRATCARAQWRRWGRTRCGGSTMRE